MEGGRRWFLQKSIMEWQKLRKSEVMEESIGI
jgi:hypothetical protein